MATLTPIGEPFEAIILAGGLGTRLAAAVPGLPKAMAPIAGRPFIDLLLDSLADAGCSLVTIAVSYRREAIIQHVGNHHRDMLVAYSVEDKPLGTGGAMRQALTTIRNSDCVVLNGDTWLELDYAALLRQKRASSAVISIAAREVGDVSRYGALEIVDGRVVALHEKCRTGRGFVNAGVYAIDQPLFSNLPIAERQFSFESDFLIPNLPFLRPVAFPVDGEFIDIGVPSDLIRAQAILGGSLCSHSSGRKP